MLNKPLSSPSSPRPSGAPAEETAADFHIYSTWLRVLPMLQEITGTLKKLQVYLPFWRKNTRAKAFHKPAGLFPGGLKKHCICKGSQIYHPTQPIQDTPHHLSTSSHWQPSSFSRLVSAYFAACFQEKISLYSTPGSMKNFAAIALRYLSSWLAARSMGAQASRPLMSIIQGKSRKHAMYSRTKSRIPLWISLIPSWFASAFPKRSIGLETSDSCRHPCPCRDSAHGPLLSPLPGPKPRNCREGDASSSSQYIL